MGTPLSPSGQGAAPGEASHAGRDAQGVGLGDVAGEARVLRGAVAGRAQSMRNDLGI
jgi:hypothetical protein